MTEQEKRKAARRIAEAFDRLSDAGQSFILGYAEGVIAKAEADREKKTA